MDSILTSIKKLLGITPEYEQFDVDIIMHINAVFLTLSQLGVGPKNGFMITGANEQWREYLPENDPNYEAVKIYIHAKVKLAFDPTSLTPAAMESMKEIIKEFEWRLSVQVETPVLQPTEEEEELEYVPFLQ